MCNIVEIVGRDVLEQIVVNASVLGNSIHFIVLELLMNLKMESLCTVSTEKRLACGTITLMKVFQFFMTIKLP